MFSLVNSTKYRKQQQIFDSTVNMTLPNFAAERRAAAPSLLGAGAGTRCYRSRIACGALNNCRTMG